MRFCGKCGSKCEDNTKFCQNCGAPLSEEAPKQSSTVNDPAGSTVKSPESGVSPNMNAANPNTGAKKTTSGFAVASLVLGIVGIITGFFGVALATIFGMGIAIIFLVPSMLAIAFGLIVMIKYEKKGLAIAGFVLGLLFFIIFLISAIYTSQYYNIYSAYSNEVRDIFDALDW